MIELNKLKELAVKASPGPWSHNIDQKSADIDGPNGGVICWIQEHGSVRTVDNNNGEWFSYDDARYIAAANPATILELLDRLGSAELALGYYAGAMYYDGGQYVVNGEMARNYFKKWVNL